MSETHRHRHGLRHRMPSICGFYVQSGWSLGPFKGLEACQQLLQGCLLLCSAFLSFSGWSLALFLATPTEHSSDGLRPRLKILPLPPMKLMHALSWMLTSSRMGVDRLPAISCSMIKWCPCETLLGNARMPTTRTTRSRHPRSCPLPRALSQKCSSPSVLHLPPCRGQP